MVYNKKVIMKIKTIIAILLIVTAAFPSCRGTKEISKSEDLTEKTTSCLNMGRSDKNFFRVFSNGKGKDLESSRENALFLAKQHISNLINLTMKNVIVLYANDVEAGDGNNLVSSFENISKSIVSKQVTDSIIICEERRPDDNGMYETVLAIELGTGAFIKGMEQVISKDYMLSLMYDREVFLEHFYAEMEKINFSK
jgi:hypothetical protein